MATSVHIAKPRRGDLLARARVDASAWTVAATRNDVSAARAMTTCTTKTTVGPPG